MDIITALGFFGQVKNHVSANNMTLMATLGSV